MGTKRFSLKPGAVSRYYFIAEYMAVHMRMLRYMIGQDSSKLPHPDLQGPMIRTDEADIKSLIDLMENNWLNPLSPDESDLVSLSTGTVTPPEMVKDLLRPFDVGEEAYQTFKRTRWWSIIRGIPRHGDKAKTENVPNNQHKDITNEKSKCGSKVRPKPLQPDDPGSWEQMCEHVWCPGPPTGSTVMGTGKCRWSLRKTYKAAFARELEKNVSHAEVIATPST